MERQLRLTPDAAVLEGVAYWGRNLACPTKAPQPSHPQPGAKIPITLFGTEFGASRRRLGEDSGKDPGDTVAWVDRKMILNLPYRISQTSVISVPSGLATRLSFGATFPTLGSACGSIGTGRSIATPKHFASSPTQLATRGPKARPKSQFSINTS